MWLVDILQLGGLALVLDLGEEAVLHLATQGLAGHGQKLAVNGRHVLGLVILLALHPAEDFGQILAGVPIGNVYALGQIIEDRQIKLAALRVRLVPTGIVAI